MPKYTVYFEPMSNRNFQVEAVDKEEAIEKARKVYHKHTCIPDHEIEEGWRWPEQGEDK